MSDGGFDRFGVEMIQFLLELDANNNKAWWAANKARYERHVRGPALAFITAMSTRLPAISPHFLALPKKVGGSMMRPYRDTRFSADKTPYKTNLGIQFRHRAGKDIHAPGWYVHISHEDTFLGVGMWHPDGQSLGDVRKRIDAEQSTWLSIRDEATFKTNWALEGNALVRAPRGYDIGHPLIEDLRRKDFIAVAHLDFDDVLDAGFLDATVARFETATPFMRFLTEAVGQPF
jgi:uncharacterized protein (TIGR02453 family)